jgi:hypothetical protein
MPSLELALLLPLSIATAWSIGATKKVAAADNLADFSEIVAHHRNMIRNAFLFLTGLVSIANLLSLAGLVQAILGGHAGSLSSTLRILSGEAEGFGESIPKFDGNFHAVWALPGH